MHKTLTDIQEKLAALSLQVQNAMPNDEPLGIVQNNWSFPGLTRAELIEEADSISALIDERGGDDIGDSADRLNDYIRRLEHLRNHTVAQLWGNGGQAVSAYMLTLNGLRKALEPALTTDAAATLRKLAQKVRSMEARLKDLEPRTATLATMVARIEKAYETADQLPADLEALSEARQKIAVLEKAAAKDQLGLHKIREDADELDQRLKKSAENAESVLERCETAYSAATSVGLAAAFNERSESLAKSMWFWICGLVGALIAGSYFGSGQLHTLSELFKLPNAAASVIVLNLLLSLLSVAAPVWFAWLATKQIGQRFRLSEDYAFKASISRAYEGFRREAARFDKDMEGRLLSSALTRLDELPLRLVETNSHGSPWHELGHELASSDVVKQALKAVPGFAEQVKDLAGKAVSAVTPPKGKTVMTSDDPE